MTINPGAAQARVYLYKRGATLAVGMLIIGSMVLTMGFDTISRDGLPRAYGQLGLAALMISLGVYKLASARRWPATVQIVPGALLIPTGFAWQRRHKRLEMTSIHGFRLERRKGQLFVHIFYDGRNELLERDKFQSEQEFQEVLSFLSTHEEYVESYLT